MQIWLNPSPSGQIPQMMNFKLITGPPELSKLTFVNIKLKCARISLKMDSARTLINANLPMDTINYLISLLPPRKPIELENVNLFGKREFAVMDLDANFPIMKKKIASQNNSWEWWRTWYAPKCLIAITNFFEFFRKPSNEPRPFTVLFIYFYFVDPIHFIADSIISKSTYLCWVAWLLIF